MKAQKDPGPLGQEEPGNPPLGRLGDHFGYKNHIAIDNKHKIIRAYEVTSAEAHDSQKLMDVSSENTSRDFWADSAYRS